MTTTLQTWLPSVLLWTYYTILKAANLATQREHLRILEIDKIGDFGEEHFGRVCSARNWATGPGDAFFCFSKTDAKLHKKK